MHHDDAARLQQREQGLLEEQQQPCKGEPSAFRITIIHRAEEGGLDCGSAAHAGLGPETGQGPRRWMEEEAGPSRA